MGETCALSNGDERGLRLRAALVDMKEQLNIRRRDETASASMGHVWFSDCESLFSHLVSPNTKQVDSKRLAIKQLVWEHRNDCDEHVDGSKGDFSRWIDTSTMPSDCLTKTMSPDR